MHARCHAPENNAQTMFKKNIVLKLDKLSFKFGRKIILDNLNYTTVADFNFDNNINLFDLLLHIDKVNHNNPLNFLDCL